MEKIKRIIKKSDVDVILLVLIFVAICSFCAAVDSNDELWNFANCYKMFNGYRIYEELNVIITPLFFYIAQIFFRIFGANILVFRVYNLVIFIILFMLIYLIFKKLNIARRRAIFYTFAIMIFYNKMIMAGANYNVLVMLPILACIIIILNKNENFIIYGILLFLTFMIKQNIYVLFAIGIFIYKIMNINDARKTIVELIKTYAVSVIGIGLFLLYLYINENLYDFVNICFLGISEFKDSNIGIEFSGSRFYYISIISILFSLVLIFNRKMNKKIDENIIKNIKCLISFGIPMLIMAYPIFNYYHSTLASLILIIETIYVIENMLIKNMRIEIKKEKMTYTLISIIFFIYLFIIIIFSIKENEYVFNNKGSLYGSVITKDNYKDIQIVCNYISQQQKKGIDVKILSYKAQIYMIQLNKNNYMFDLAFTGNLGKNGEDGLIEMIENSENTIILISNDYEKISYQESKKAIDYIITNYKKIDEIQNYSAYCIKK